MTTTDFERWLAGYQPRALSDAQWALVGPFVREQMLLLPRVGRHRAERMRAMLLSRLAAWSVAHGTALDAEALFAPDNVERHITALGDEYGSPGDVRSTFRTIGRVLAPTVCPPKAPARKNRSLAPPYTPGEMCLLRLSLGMQHTAFRTRAAETLMSLGHGAGLNGKWNIHVGPEHVTVERAAVLVRVGDPAARVVAVTQEWEDTVVRLAEQARRRGWPLLVGKRRGDPNRSSTLASEVLVPRGAPKVNTSRLRTTWMVERLNAGVDVRVLLGAAGIIADSLRELLQYVEPVAADEAYRQLRKGVRR